MKLRTFALLCSLAVTTACSDDSATKTANPADDAGSGGRGDNPSRPGNDGNNGNNENNGDGDGDGGGKTPEAPDWDPDLDSSRPRDVIDGLVSEMEDYDCAPGTTFCLKTRFVECRTKTYSHFYYAQDCDRQENAPLCDDSYGCVACTPGLTYCDRNDVYACNGDGTLKTKLKTCGGNTVCLNGKCDDGNACPLEAQLIYLVDSDYNLLSFNPGADDKQYLKRLNPLKCSARSTPFSMAVDRQANAWVLYQDGTLYKVDIHTNACTEITNFTQNGSGLSRFGMGFSLKEIGASEDVLFIGDYDRNGHFGRINTQQMTYERLAQFPDFYEQTPELTGTGLAKVYAFAPGAKKQFISEIDKNTGNVLHNYELPGAGSQISAWAFAHWGGYFFAFETTNNVNKIYKYDMQNEKFELFLDKTPYRVVGAGVSTCAPVLVN